MDDWEDEAETIPCPACRAEIFEDAEQCPVCGEYVIRSRSSSPLAGKPAWYAALVILGIIGVILALALGGF